MSIVSKNRGSASNNRIAQQKNTNQALYAGFKNALSGSDGAVGVHTGRWNGYVDNVASVTVYGKVHKVNAVHGYKGLPKNREVAVRVARNYIIADFQ